MEETSQHGVPLELLPPIDLADPASVALHRTALVSEMPAILETIGLPEQAGWLRTGQYERVETWFTQAVSIKNHGIAEGGIGLTPAQTAAFNPAAQRHEMISPTLELWRPGDDLPDGALPGDIKQYASQPRYEALPPAVYEADNKKIVGGATLRGMTGRIANAVELIERSEPSADAAEAPHELVILTGMRPTTAKEGADHFYTDLFPAGTEPLPIQQVLPSEADAAIALANHQLENFQEDRDALVPDPEAGGKPPERTNELGGRTWITRYFDATTPGGKPVRVTVVNGEPILQLDAANRPKGKAAPVLAETLTDWMHTLPKHQKQDLVLSISYPHLLRTAARLHEQVTKTGMAHRLGSLILAGGMPPQEVWTEVKNGMHQGGTLGLKELWPMIRVFNRLTGRAQNDLSPN